jgi:hypothetical protein
MPRLTIELPICSLFLFYFLIYFHHCNPPPICIFQMINHGRSLSRSPPPHPSSSSSSSSSTSLSSSIRKDQHIHIDRSRSPTPSRRVRDNSFNSLPPADEELKDMGFNRDNVWLFSHLDRSMREAMVSKYRMAIASDLRDMPDIMRECRKYWDDKKRSSREGKDVPLPVSSPTSSTKSTTAATTTESSSSSSPVPKPQLKRSSTCRCGPRFRDLLYTYWPSSLTQSIREEEMKTHGVTYRIPDIRTPISCVCGLSLADGDECEACMEGENCWDGPCICSVKSSTVKHSRCNGQPKNGCNVNCYPCKRIFEQPSIF